MTFAQGSILAGAWMAYFAAHSALASLRVKRWVARARAFADVAQSPHAPLAVVDCDVPASVEQNPISVVEVQLSLHIRCRIDTPAHFPKSRTDDSDDTDESY